MSKVTRGSRKTFRRNRKKRKAQNPMSARDNRGNQDSAYGMFMPPLPPTRVIRQYLSPTARICRSLQPYPDCAVVNLRWLDPTTSRNNAAANYVSWRYRMNSVYDVDPTLGTTAFPAFAEWAAFFRLYRVLRFSYNITLSSLDSTHSTVIMTAPTSVDVGANYTGLNDFPGQPYSRRSEISIAGGMDKTTLRGTIDLEQFEGSAQYVTSDGFASLVTTNPSTQRFFNVGGITAGAVFSSGLAVSAELVLTTLFYGRVNLTA